MAWTLRFRERYSAALAGAESPVLPRGPRDFARPAALYPGPLSLLAESGHNAFAALKRNMLFFKRKPDTESTPEPPEDAAAPKASPSADALQEAKEEPEEKFFSVRYSARALITPFKEGEEIPPESDFLREIPELFNIASPCSPSDLVRFRRMSMTPGDTGRLAAFLLMQAERINGLTRYIIDEASKGAVDTETVSAGGFTVSTSFPGGTIAHVQVFLPEYGTAAYAIARAEDPCEQEKSLLPPDTAQCAFFRFIIIRDQDRAALQSAIAEIERKSLRERRAASKKNTE